MQEELRKYEEKLLKELEGTKLFSWKRLWKTIELTSIYEALNG